MAEDTLLDPSEFDSFPQVDPSELAFLDPKFFPDDLPLSPGLLSDLDFDDISLDFSLDDLVLPTEDEESPRCNGSSTPDSKEGSRASSYSLVNSYHSSDLAGDINPASLDSGRSDSRSPDSGHCLAGPGAINQEAKLEEERNGSGLKRKKDGSTNTNPNHRSSKFRRSEEANSLVFRTGSEEVEKRKARLVRNRESAHLSRQRKKQHIEKLEQKVRSMRSMISELNSKISYCMAENASLRQQMSLNGGHGPPMAPTRFPWIPFSWYPLRPHSSRVPLIPIPTMQTQKPSWGPKAKKSMSKIKKVASVSFLGLLFVVLIFGGLLPEINLRYSGSRDRSLVQSKSRVLSVSGRAGSSNSSGAIGFCGGKIGQGEGGLKWVTGKKCENRMVGSAMEQNEIGSVGLVYTQNMSESLPALLYVPRNGKHIEINGSLIINSVIAGDRATVEVKSGDQATQTGGTEGSEPAFAIEDTITSTLAVSEAGMVVGRHSKSYKKLSESQRVPASDSEDNYGNSLKSTPADGTLQQWLHKGLAAKKTQSYIHTLPFPESRKKRKKAVEEGRKVRNKTYNKRKGKGKKFAVPRKQEKSLLSSTVHNRLIVNKHKQKKRKERGGRSKKEKIRREKRKEEEQARRRASDLQVLQRSPVSSQAFWRSMALLAGPILSSGTCSELYQFDVLPSSANLSSIFPARSMVNSTDKLLQTSAHLGKMKNRRILNRLPIPLTGTLNNTHYLGKPSESSNLHGNSSVPSMVVSLLAGPREADAEDYDGTSSTKSLSSIFVVVLMDNVKYVTYSCSLPLKSL